MTSTAELPLPTATSHRHLIWPAAFAAPLVLLMLWNAILRDANLPGQLGTLAGSLLIALMAIVAYTDIRWRLIPNWATYTGFVYGLLLNFLAGPNASPEIGAVGFGNSLGGACLLFFPMLVIWIVSGGGLGDVKLVACIGTLLGLQKGVDAVAYSFACAGVAIACWAVLSYGPLSIIRSLGRKVGHFVVPLWVAQPEGEQQKLLTTQIPLAPFFAAGSMLALLDVVSFIP